MSVFPVLPGLLAAAVIAGAPARAADRPSPHPLTAANVEAWLDGFLPYALEQADIAGAVVVVVADGKVLVQKGYGYADAKQRVPVAPHRTVFRLGSVAKLFTWTAAMQLVESGRLDLDRDVNEYLDFTIPSRYGQPVTLRNLMTHTPGFEEVIKNLIIDDPERLPALGEYLATWIPERIHAPGEIPAYSNYGAALAGYIVQRVSGQPFDEYVERHLFLPLGMRNTTTRQPLPDRLAPYMSKGYVMGSAPARPFELVGPSPAGGGAATGADMARFMLAYLQEGELDSARILEPETVRMMVGTRLQIVPSLDGMLLGFFEQNLNGRRVAAHYGDTQFFHARLDLLVDDGVGVFQAFNSTGSEAGSIAIRRALMHQFMDRYFPADADERAADPQTAAEHARLMAGTYESSRRSQSSFFHLATLLSQGRVTVGRNGDLVIPVLTGLDGQPMQWREVAPFVWHEVGGKERLAARVEDGEVVMFGVSSTSPFLVFQPVAWWKSSTLLMPLVSFAAGAILLTVVAWPAAAVLRRRYAAVLPLTGARLRTRRLVRIAGVATIAILVAWGSVVSRLSSDLSIFAPTLDPWILLLRVSTLTVFAGATLIALWNARLAWAEQRRWGSKLWSVLLAFASGTLLRVAFVSNLVGFDVNY